MAFGEQTFPSPHGIADNIIRFAKFCRKNDIHVPFSSVPDAVAGIHLIDISRIDAVYCLLRACFVSNRDEFHRFERLFRSFWFLNEIFEKNDSACGKEKTKIQKT